MPLDLQVIKCVKGSPRIVIVFEKRTTRNNLTRNVSNSTFENNPNHGLITDHGILPKPHGWPDNVYHSVLDFIGKKFNCKRRLKNENIM